MKNILEYLECSAGRWPEKTACARYRYIDDMADAAGGGSTDRLFIADASDDPSAGGCLYGETPACLAAMLGTVYGGDFYTVIDTKMPWDRIRKIFSVLKPAAVITDRDHEETVREAWKQSGRI